MAVCASCGKAIAASRGGVGIRSKRKAYHISCAPAALLDTAIEEWDAIISRGIEYFEGKYVPAGSPESTKRDEDALLRSFSRFGEKLKLEARTRRSSKA